MLRIDIMTVMAMGRKLDLKSRYRAIPNMRINTVVYIGLYYLNNNLNSKYVNQFTLENG